ncbi:MAG: YegS/Rv2252/BmrU family lipid kinase [Streptosporangiales bacterium]|nr:YegS/Rv2252/BmrU family lipid kinase [Streptosporangiales bacterium]
MPRTIGLLANPAAGGGRGVRHLEAVVRRLRAGGAEVRVLQGTSAVDSTRLARELMASGPGALVALGGDGIVHLAVQAVAGTGVPLGIIPSGTGNDIAREFGLPLRDPVAAAEVVLSGRRARYDLGRCGDQHFASVLACGLDSKVNERANRMRRLRGRAKYVAALFAELPRFRPVPFTLELDGVVTETEAALVAVGNTGMYGAGMRICPGARPDDGMFEVVVVAPASKARLLRTFPKVYGGGHVTMPEVTCMQARQVRIAAPDLIAYADGEPLGPLPVECSVRPGAIEVLVPRDAAAPAA